MSCAEQLDLMRGSRRGLFESHGKARCVCLPRSSSAVASSRQAAQGHPAKRGTTPWGGLPLVTFLGRARKVTCRRATPGPAKRTKGKKGTDLFSYGLIWRQTRQLSVRPVRQFPVTGPSFWPLSRNTISTVSGILRPPNPMLLPSFSNSSALADISVAVLCLLAIRL